MLDMTKALLNSSTSKESEDKRLATLRAVIRLQNQEKRRAMLINAVEVDTMNKERTTNIPSSPSSSSPYFTQSQQRQNQSINNPKIDTKLTQKTLTTYRAIKAQEQEKSYQNAENEKILLNGKFSILILILNYIKIKKLTLINLK